MHFFERTRGSNDSSDSEKSELERKIEAVTEKAREADEGVDPDKDNDETQDDAKSRFLEAPKDEQQSHLLLTTAITSSTDSSGGDAISCQQDTDDAKSRFLQPSDAAKSSLLLSKTIRSSIDVVDGMPSQDTIQSVPSVSTVEEADNEEPLSQPDIQGRQDEAAAEAAPSAKSRFLESCVESENEPEDEGQSTIPRQNPQTGRWETGAASWGKLLEAELADDIEFYESDEELEKEPNSRDEYVPETEAQRSDGDEDDDDDVELLGAAAPKPRRRETTAYGTASDIFSPWYNKAVVIDNGSDVLKIGLAGGYIPSITMPTIVGRKRGYDLSERDRHTYIGDDALANQGVLGFDYPIEGGVVGNWSDLERIWDHVFTYELALNPADHPVLLTEISTTPRHQREKYFEVLFERFHVPAVFLVNQAVLALHASGCTSGVVLSSGSGITEVVPIYEGFCMTHAVTVLDVAGRQVTGQLASLLQHNKGYNFTTSSEWEILRIMKERLAFVASDIEEEKRRSRVVEAHEYKLPDGQTMSVSDELFMCTEPMFQPERAGITDSPGIHSLVMESLQRCDPEIRAMLKDMLILAGGNTKLRGFVPRLQKELAGLNLNMYVNAPSEREHSSWVGGSILASHSSFMDRWVTMEEYADQGSEIVHRKCF
ncbi:actin, plasmodial isoform-like [Ptychodera flava]|uniref:actin, plasmodial isoform-like n=1 Tax=Ptychodera flava TaxID=63121 RepID=UPI00396A7F73